MKYSTKIILLLLLLTNLVYAFMLLVTIPKVMHFSGGMELLDLMPAGYDTEYVDTLFRTLGQQGRNAYLFHQLPVDMLYPFLFGVTYCLLLAHILNKLGKSTGHLTYLCLLPLLAALFDYSENAGIIALLSHYPKNNGFLVVSTNVSTILKSCFTTSYFLVLVISLIALGIQTRRVTLIRRFRFTSKISSSGPVADLKRNQK